MQARLAGLALSLIGCSFSAGSASSSSDAPHSDAAVDARPDSHDATMLTADSALCFGNATIDAVCLDALPTTSVTFATTTIDTGDSSLCQIAIANGVSVCVVAFESITIPDNVTVSVKGNRPLVLVATSPAGVISLAGPMAIIDAGSHTNGSSGPAIASTSDCTVGAASASGQAGGYGGSMAFAGGAGGDDNTASGHGVPGAALAVPATLHGGCLGGIGAGNGSLAAGAGGAVALIASAIHVMGVISASGAGGAGGHAGTGGSGGGAGGLVVLDAPTVDGSGSSLTQGGGGGEGSSGNDGNPGSDGFNAMMRPSDTHGGTGGSTAGDGGNGGFGMTAPMPGMAGPPGGGGQGGGGGGGSQGFTFFVTS